MPAERPLLDRDDVRRLERLSLDALEAIRIGLAGQREGPAFGTGVEFADYRPYVPGDDLRRIDWNVYGRLRELLVEISPAEASVWLSVLLDASRSMDYGEPNALRYGRRLAVLLGTVALLHSDAVQVQVLSDGAAIAGGWIDTPGMLETLVREVERLPAGARTELARSVDVARPGALGAEVVVLISDGLVPAADLRGALGSLSRGAGSAVFVHVLASAPVGDPPGPVALRDRESGEELVVSISESTQAAYSERHRHFVATVAEECRAAGVRHLPAPVSIDPLDLLLAAAREGALLRSGGGSLDL